MCPQAQLFFKIYFMIFVCVCVHARACVCVYNCGRQRLWILLELESQALLRCWESNSGPLPEQCALFTMESVFLPAK